MPVLIRLILAVLIATIIHPPAPLRAEGEKSGVFDYYVMALSWSPNWCAL